MTDRKVPPLATAAEELPPRAARVVAPLRAPILGTAMGVVAALAFALLTLLELVLLPHDAHLLNLLGLYLVGYRVSPQGVLIALVWGFVLGFVAGWLLAGTRNVAVWLWLELVRVKANLGRSDFLDDIS